jgi:hypothetical protein
MSSVVIEIRKTIIVNVEPNDTLETIRTKVKQIQCDEGVADEGVKWTIVGLLQCSLCSRILL